MTMPLEARGVSPQEAEIIHSPVLDVVRQRLSYQGAFIVRESVTTGVLDNYLSSSKVLQLVELYTTPRAYDYKGGLSKEDNANNIVAISRDLMRYLTRTVTVDNFYRKTIDRSEHTVWPVRQGSRIGNGVLFFDEILGQERVKSEVETTETRRGSLKEVGVNSGRTRRNEKTPLVRRIVLDIYPHPLLALVVPRTKEKGLRIATGARLKVVGPEVTVDRLADIQRYKANSVIALAALEYGLVTQQELQEIFDKAA